MDTETTTTPTDKPTVDPFMKDLAASMGAAIDETGALKPIEAAATRTETPVVLPKPSRSLAEMVTDNAAAAEAKKNQPDPAKETQTETPAATTPAATTTTTTATTTTEPAKPEAKPEDKPKTEAKANPEDSLAKTLTELKQVPSSMSPKAPSVLGEIPKEDSDYVKTLTEEQQEELRLAQFAEKNGEEGIYKRTLSFFRQSDEFVTKNPGLTPDSQEFEEFVDKHKPRWQNRGKAERLLIKEEAKAEVKSESARELEELRARQRTLEVAPKIEKAIDQFREVLTSPAISDQLPEGVKPISTKVGEAIRSQGYEAAQKKFPILAPIYQGAVAMAREFMDVTNGVKPWQPDRDRNQAWLSSFIDNQEQVLLRAPKEKQIVHGRQFLTSADYAKLPADKLDQHWTLSDRDILNLLAANAHLMAHAKLSELREASELEEMGFKRGGDDKTQTTTKPATPPSAGATPEKTGETPSAPSPKASVSMQPGAGATTPVRGTNAGLLDSLVPGAAQRLGV